MKRSFLVLLLVITGFSFAGAQKTFNAGNAEKRNTGSFHGIQVGTGIELVITEGTIEEVAVSAESTEFRDHIVTKVENGILKIHYDSKLSSINKKKVKKNLKAWVSYKKLDELTASTGAHVQIEGTLKSSSLSIKANTGAEIRGKVEATDLKVSQNTGSLIVLTGETASLGIEGSTGSLFKGSDLQASTCDAEVSTGAGITITAQKELYVKANTGGYVKYRGDAAIREIRKNTGGYVSKM